MGKKYYTSLGEVLKGTTSGEVPNGSILTNEDTGERVVIKDGNFHFLTTGDYVSQEVPLTRGMILAKWSVDTPDYKLIELPEAVETVSKGIPIKVNGETVDTIKELLETWTMTGGISLSLLNGMTYAVDADKVSPNKFARKTTETDAWAILMDIEFMDYSVEEVADKFGISVRSVYYILDGTHYTHVHKRFHDLVESGELYFGNNQ